MSDTFGPALSFFIAVTQPIVDAIPVFPLLLLFGASSAGLWHLSGRKRWKRSEPQIEMAVYGAWVLLCAATLNSLSTAGTWAAFGSVITAGALVVGYLRLRAAPRTMPARRTASRNATAGVSRVHRPSSAAIAAKLRCEVCKDGTRMRPRTNSGDGSTFYGCNNWSPTGGCRFKLGEDEGRAVYAAQLEEEERTFGLTATSTVGRTAGQRKVDQLTGIATIGAFLLQLIVTFWN